MWPAIDDRSRLFDASTLLDSTMDPFSLRLAVYSKSSSFRAPEPQKCLHLPELGLCMFTVKAFGVVRSVNSECVHLSFDILHTTIRTRTSTRDTLSLYIQGRRKISRKKKERKKNWSNRRKTRSLISFLRANLKTWNSDQISETLSLVVYVVLK